MGPERAVACVNVKAKQKNIKEKWPSIVEMAYMSLKNFRDE